MTWFYPGLKEVETSSSLHYTCSALDAGATWHY